MMIISDKIDDDYHTSHFNILNVVISDRSDFYSS